MSDDKSSKTEKPTDKKLRDARKKGQVPRSKEIVSTVLLAMGAVYLWLSWEWQLAHLVELIQAPANLQSYAFHDALKQLLDLVTQDFILLLAPLVVTIILGGLVGNIMQFGVLFASDSIKPKFDKISPINGFKRIFSAKHLLETLIAAAKVLAISGLLAWIIVGSLRELVHDVSACDVACLKTLLEIMVQRLILALLPLLIVLSVADYVLQRSHFIKEQRMTKDEVRREFKDTQGDPLIKGMRRRQQREIGDSDLRQKIRNTRVLITDSGVIAIALRYEKGVTPLPLILAMGKGTMARQMMDVAGVENIPVVNDPTLALLLLTEGTVDQYLPSVAVEPAARVIRRTPEVSQTTKH
ncbi:MAG: EscU/YscU/HrcU family type III secretion system export apparatus switch protein [Candidatus Competibacteraceae bacterium]|jgi:type III secretion protein U|nr:EscU/YscU/HrcU family type III secretion system export apparatus switch protein [Candidatus Competibacteraceae bacterium]